MTNEQNKKYTRLNDKNGRRIADDDIVKEEDTSKMWQVSVRPNTVIMKSLSDNYETDCFFISWLKTLEIIDNYDQ